MKFEPWWFYRFMRLNGVVYCVGALPTLVGMYSWYS